MRKALEFSNLLSGFDRIIKAESFRHDIPGLDPDDIAQKIRIRLWRKFHLFNPEKASFKTWSNVLMRNAIKNMKRDAYNRTNAPLNTAVSIQVLEENGLEIDEDRKIFRPKPDND